MDCCLGSNRMSQAATLPGDGPLGDLLLLGVRSVVRRSAR